MYLLDGTCHSKQGIRTVFCWRTNIYAISKVSTHTAYGTSSDINITLLQESAYCVSDSLFPDQTLHNAQLVVYSVLEPNMNSDTYMILR